jgi:hypothetical protein
MRRKRPNSSHNSLASRRAVAVGPEQRRRSIPYHQGQNLPDQLPNAKNDVKHDCDGIGRPDTDISDGRTAKPSVGCDNKKDGNRGDAP